MSVKNTPLIITFLLLVVFGVLWFIGTYWLQLIVIFGLILGLASFIAWIINKFFINSRV